MHVREGDSTSHSIRQRLGDEFATFHAFEGELVHEANIGLVFFGDPELIPVLPSTAIGRADGIGASDAKG